MASICSAAPAVRPPLAILGGHRPMNRARNSSITHPKLGPTLSHAPFVSSLHKCVLEEGELEGLELKRKFYRRVGLAGRQTRGLLWLFNNAIRWQTKQRLSAVFAQGPSGGDSNKDKSDGIANDDARGPPIATILAGFLVFFLFGWVFISIITWLFSLTVKLPPT